MSKHFSILDHEFVNTSESYSKTLFIEGNKIVIPYINICLMPENPINSTHSVVDYSYYVFENVALLSSTEKGGIHIEFGFEKRIDLITEYITLGGYEMHPLQELRIHAEKASLYLTEKSNIKPANNAFVPSETPNLSSNMNNDDVLSFFLLEEVPKNLIQLLNQRVYSMSFNK